MLELNLRVIGSVLAVQIALGCGGGRDDKADSGSADGPIKDWPDAALVDASVPGSVADAAPAIVEPGELVEDRSVYEQDDLAVRLIHLTVTDLEGLDAADFQRIYGVNVIGAYQMIRACVPAMKAQGMKELISVREAAEELGLDPTTPLLGYAVSVAAVADSPEVVDGLARASRAAKEMLATDDALWDELRPLMNAASDEEFAQSLAYALRFDERGRPRAGGWEFAAALAAERLVEHLRRSNFVVMKRRPTPPHGAG